eukprot:488026_1
MTSLLVIIAIAILTCSIFLHFNKHFTLRSFTICTPPDGQDLDFFPYSFQIYLMIEIFMCILLITRMIITNDSIDKYNHISSNNFTELNHIYQIYDFNSSNPLIINIIDCIMVYFVMIISLMESMFTWYRFYTTYMASMTLQDLETLQVFKKYSLYAATFALLYILTFNLYYWIFPLVIILHGTFNVYCNHCFASMLIKTYSAFTTLSRHSTLSADAANQQVLDAVYLMRKISLICTIIQSIYLCLFIIIYYININLIVIYIPILWSISSFIFALNFARNRAFVQNLFIKIKSKSSSCKIKCKCFQFIINKDNETTTDTTHPITIVIPTTPTPKINQSAQRHQSDETAKTPILQDQSQYDKFTINVEEYAAPAMSDNLSPELDETPFPKTGPTNTPYELKNINIKTDCSVQFSQKKDEIYPLTPDFGSTPTERLHLSPCKYRRSNTLYDDKSIEYTQNHSAFDLSIQTETDLDGTKKSEFDRYIRVNTLHDEDKFIDIDDDTLPDEDEFIDIDDDALPEQMLNMPHNSSVASKIMVNTNDVMNREHEVIEKEIVKRKSLDSNQLFVQLSLLKKFGFDVDKIKKGFE